MVLIKVFMYIGAAIVLILIGVLIAISISIWGMTIDSVSSFKETLNDVMDYRGYENKTLRYEIEKRMIYCFKYENLNSHKKICKKLDAFEKTISKNELLLKDGE